MRRHNYTLMELITVTVILMLLLSIGTMRFRADWWAGTPEQKAEEFRRMAAICRRQAAATGKVCAIVFDPEHRCVRGGGERLTYPEELQVWRNGRELEQSEILVRFFPDGSATAAVVEFRSRGETVPLRISPLTGGLILDQTE